MATIEQGMGKYITDGVYVITTTFSDVINGQAASWVMRVSQEPFLIAIALYEKNYTEELVLKSGVFAVNVLKEGQQEIAKHFGRQSGRKVDKFETIKFHRGKTGAPILNDCLAYLECEVIFSKKLGDHRLFVGKVVGSGVLNEGRPLIYRHEDYF
jgi:flavin reductase (DIM6/NTAB) family NADH-FMN oxidoreductase RutF